MNQGTFNTALLLAPIAIGGIIAAMNTENVNDTTERLEAWARKRQQATASSGAFGKYAIGPLLWTVVGFCDWTDGFTHRGVKSGIRVAAALYLLAAWLFILFTAIKIAVMIAIVAAIVYVAFKVLAGVNESMQDGDERSTRPVSDEREMHSRDSRSDDEERPRDERRRTDVEKYRRGYERAIADIEKTRREKLSDMPEVFVKGVIGLPGEAINDFFRGADEDRGYRDAMDGKEFDPS